MFCLQVSCDECDKVFLDLSTNTCDEMTDNLKYVREENETDDQILCDECMDKVQRDKKIEDENQYYIAKGQM